MDSQHKVQHDVLWSLKDSEGVCYYFTCIKVVTGSLKFLENILFFFRALNIPDSNIGFLNF